MAGDHYIHRQKNNMCVGILFQAFRRKPKKLKSLMKGYFAARKLKAQGFKEVEENQC